MELGERRSAGLECISSRKLAEFLKQKGLIPKNKKVDTKKDSHLPATKSPGRTKSGENKSSGGQVQPDEGQK
ncbi:MAG: hypothetical protein ACD_77C00114G0002 [uncultured bacterium]|nr:MAG: hypothetical protein ACD_77C00114G0002 [uncultured bacterium]